MDYNYEALDDKRFQKLCQALIAANFPDVQCLPVGESDGGRDAFLTRDHDGTRDVIVFQVKFSRNPDRTTARTALRNLVNAEQDKVAKLSKSGVTAYYFITNTKGTSYPDTGSIDSLNKLLVESFKIPCHIWWRDDIDRRLDNSPDIKWSYPEILKATDVLPLPPTSISGFDKQKCERTIKTYLAGQYAAESDVKFKQVDLRHKLTDVFVDLPLGHTAPQSDQRIESIATYDPADAKSYADQLRFYESYGFDNGGPFEHAGLVAAFFLHMPLTIQSACIVLEGAPGQGKSTVSQFLCQVNRIRLLRKFDELNAVSDHFISSPVRIPFKLDLRDYAIWMSGKNPYHASETETHIEQSVRSIENFLAMHVEHHSGGLSVSLDELFAFLERSHLLIVLDGFDEVADITTRKRVVEEIDRAAERLELHAKSIQLIITSRPVAFANSSTFREDKWTHLKLNALRRSNIINYKTKWIKAQDIGGAEGHLISSTLDEKLEKPHFKDLARNPMQLAILLHLIHVKGVALPEKRTTLYEQYMNLFFDREAAKSNVVRDNRELLLSIHGVLAWVLHTQVECGMGPGRISESDLKACVKGFLQSEGHKEDLVNALEVLFQGTVERIGALISRVPSTFEFEVQPLREYFAACHLHQTAPYSPPGRERKGARSDRFEVLAQSSFWTNVTRFFCGFYDKGELSSLVDGITELGSRNGHNLINQPRQLAIMLLADHVFSQVPRVTARLIEFVTSEPGFQRLYATGPPQRSRDMGLPTRAGRSSLFEVCKSRLEEETDPCRRRALREVMAENADEETLKMVWMSRYRDGLITSSPLHEAMDFGVINRFSDREIKSITKDDKTLCASWLMGLHKYDAVIADPDLYATAIKMVFDGELQAPLRRYLTHPPTTSIEKILVYLNPYLIVRLFTTNEADRRGDLTYRSLLRFSTYSDQNMRVDGRVHRDSIDEYADAVASICSQKVIDLQQHAFAWSDLIDRGFAEAPKSHLIVKAALVAAAGKSQASSGAWSNEEFSPTKGLLSRLLFARGMAADEGWWRRRLAATTSDSAAICLASMIVWGDPEVVVGLKSEVARITDQLPRREWKRIRSMMQLMLHARRSSRTAISEDWFEEIWPTSFRLAHLVIGLSDDLELGRRLSRKAFHSYNGKDVEILREAFRIELHQTDPAKVDWDYVQRLSMHSHTVGACTWFTGWESPEVPKHVAEQVLWNCTSHCLGLVSICEAAYSKIVSQRAAKLLDSSEANQWFETPC